MRKTTMLPENIDPKNLVRDPHGRVGHWVHVPTGDAYALPPDWMPDGDDGASDYDRLANAPMHEILATARALEIDTKGLKKADIVAAIIEKQAPPSEEGAQ